MARWRGIVAAVGALGAGAGLAAARARRRAPETVPPAPAPAAGVATPVAPADVADDPQGALDEARERLRRRSDELRRAIEDAGGAPPSPPA